MWQTRSIQTLAGAVLGFSLLWPMASAAQMVPLIRAAEIDAEAGTVTLPLHHGRMTGGESVWYVLLDASNRDTAERLGINFSGKLANADIGGAVRQAEIAPEGELVFDAGRVDFQPERLVEPGPAGSPFPPARAFPGSVGDEDYTPLIRIGAAGNTIFNAPVLAFDVDADSLNVFCRGGADHALMHDKVVRICPRDGTVTLSLTDGFAGGKALSYVSTESNVALVAALEGATHAPRLGDLPAAPDDKAWSAVEPIFVVINGATGAAHAARQGLASALLDGLSPRNVTGDVPGLGAGYSPLWASHPVVWDADAIDRRVLITGASQVRALENTGAVHGFDGGAVRADGILVNCPVIFRAE